MSTRLARPLFTVLLVAAVCDEALACSCHLLSAHDRYGNADVVFVGTAISKTFFGSGIRFHIEESFWGTTGDSIVVEHYDPIICDSFAFRVGEKYLVVAYRRNNKLTVGMCNQGAGIKLATGDIHVLRAQRQGRALPYLYGAVTTKNGIPVSNARVILQSDVNRSQILAETRTAADGYFEFQKVPPGDYSVVAFPASGGPPIKSYFWTRRPGIRLLMHGW